MNEFQAIQSFWSSFGIDAYDENTVPTGEFKPDLPYITYEVVASEFDYEVSTHASIWYYGTSWEPITKKLKEIEAVLRGGGKVIHCDGGAIWIKIRFPFAQRMADPDDDMVRRILLNISIEYLITQI